MSRISELRLAALCIRRGFKAFRVGRSQESPLRAYRPLHRHGGTAAPGCATCSSLKKLRETSTYEDDRGVLVLNWSAVENAVGGSDTPADQLEQDVQR